MERPTPNQSPFQKGDILHAQDQDENVYPLFLTEAEFGNTIEFGRFDAKNSNAPKPYHVAFFVAVDASKRIGELAE